MDFISDFVLTIALCFLVPFLLCFLLPVIVAVCPSRDDHVGKRRVLYECKPKTHEWESEVGSGFVEKAVEGDEFLGEPKKESLVLEEFVDEGLDENEVLRGDGVGCWKEKSVEEERFDGLCECECVENVFDESSERCEFGGVEFDLGKNEVGVVCFGEKNVEEEDFDGHGGVENLFDESCERREFGLGRNEVGVVCLPEKNVEEEHFDGRVGVCGYVDYLVDESSERHENENGGLEFDLDQAGVVTLPEKNVEQESCDGDGGVCRCGENLVDESSERHEFGEIESDLARNEVRVVCLLEKYVEEECSAGDVGICGCVENSVGASSEKHGFGEIEFGLARIQVGLPESEEINVSKCDGNDGTDEAKNNVVDGEVNEGFFSEDNDWEAIERTELERLFGAAVVFVGSKSNADRVSSLGSDVKMRLDGLHKIATRGPCLERQPMAFKVSARAKWNAWQQLGNMSAEVAMEQYITLLSESVPGWMQDVHGDFANPQVYETVTADLNMLIQNQSEAAGVREEEELKPDAKGLDEIGVGGRNLLSKVSIQLVVYVFANCS
ncbi:uncharacterized protein LOC112187898 isoform X2 [Rosa chinensis]|uniref:uncharacterized protein LOC112187898 isoform X2 n=1 Tax=Rosa chinensis TaxID=74649 RepID=UPI000D09271A|nr:uncharacterized protein LOC112187898 isoform X2 [Rosa chinensis]